MASVTALQMLNRVRLYRRQPETTVIATPEDVVTLNAINMAIEDVLSTRRWEFDLRHDGQIALRPLLDDVFVSTTAGSPIATLSKTGLDEADVYGDYVVRVLPDGNSEYANTTFRIKSASDPGGVSSTATLDTDFPVTITPASVTEAQLHYAEYILPDTVKEIVRISYGEEEISLIQADPVVRYDELFPAESDRTGDPEVVAVGGYDMPTFETGETATPGLRMAVWPIPDDGYVLTYSYYYRHPELSVATDTLTGVPQDIVNDIVLQAASFVMMTWDQNYAAAHFTDMAREQSAAKFRAQGGSKGRRHTISSFEGYTTRIGVERGFPGKEIG